MEAIDLKANLRDKVGKGSARFARKNNLIPAVIYGNKEKPIPISLENSDFEIHLTNLPKKEQNNKTFNKNY